MHGKATIYMAAALAAALAGGCSVEESLPEDARTAEASRQVRQRWGKDLHELPVVTLQVISPHHENIRNEFTWAFSLHEAVERGRRVNIVWRDVGGGGGSIEKYLINVYGGGGHPGIDVLWGGGEFTFMALAKEGLLERLELSEDVLENVPEQFGGQRMRDAEGRWIGSAVSGFGFLWNAGMLRRCGLEPPRQWEDLADPRFADLLALADPAQSGSAAAAYRMVVLTGRDWPDGWAKLLRVLANARKFTDSAGAAANAPALGEALVATAIDFYGAMRVAEAPGELEYLSPQGQTTFSPDPIGILRDPPDRGLAQEFVSFVLSPRGQVLWALPAGEEGGPARRPLGRQPIRRDVYQQCRGRMLPWIVDPYAAGQALVPDARMEGVKFGVLRYLVTAAAVDNRDGLRAARDRLIAAGFRDDLTAEFNALPENVATMEAMADTARQMQDLKQFDRIVSGWRAFFREKYRRIMEAP